MGPLSYGYIYRKQASRATGMELLHSPTQHYLPLCKSVCLSNHLSVRFSPLYVAKRLDPFLLFTFSHSQPPLAPLLCIPLFVPAVLIDCLFISCPAAASALVDEIVMVTVISCEDDKEGESHRVEIGFEPYGERDQDRVNNMCLTAQ